MPIIHIFVNYYLFNIRSLCIQMIVGSCPQLWPKKLNICKLPLNYLYKIYYLCKVSWFLIFFCKCDLMWCNVVASIQYAFITDEERALVWKQFQHKLLAIFPSSKTENEKLIPSKYLASIMQSLSWKEYLLLLHDDKEEEMDRSSIYTMW